MRIAIIIVRILMGLLLLFASISYFFDLIAAPEMTGSIKKFNEGVDASGYLMPLVKSLELLCGLAFVSGFFIPLAAIVILPVTINIICVHYFMAPEGLPIAIFLLAANIFLLYAKRNHYKAIFSK